MTKILVRKTSTGAIRGFLPVSATAVLLRQSILSVHPFPVLVINAINSIEQFAGEKMSVITNEEEGLIDVRFANPVNEKTTLLMDSPAAWLTGSERTIR